MLGLATYAIGDVQGCFKTLRRLLDRLELTPGRDRVWLAGDLVNRGPRSLEVLRWAAGLGDDLVAVLGNHDLHLLAVAAGLRKLHRRDTLDEILEAPDRDDLLDWLRRQPVVHHEGRWLMVHAGLLPAWTAERALELAAELETALRTGDGHAALAALQARPAPAWEDGLTGAPRLAALAAVFTRLRACDEHGELAPRFKGVLADVPEGFRAWFEFPRRHADHDVVFGHWAALGLHVEGDVIGTDSGCVWGGGLTAVRLEDREVVTERTARSEIARRG